MKTQSQVLRLFLVNWTAGALLGFLFAAAVLWFDIAGIMSLIRRSDIAIPAVALLFGGFGITFGGVVCASAVMRIPQEDEPGSDSAPPLSAELVPVRVRAQRR